MDSNSGRKIAIKMTGVKKMYKLGQIGGGTLQADLQSWWARKRGKDDPNTKIGQEQRLVGKTFMALNGIDLTVYKGEALGIIGSNGAGKSTMLKLLSRITAPTEGSIEIHGRIASMLEVGTGFNGEMTGRENIYMNGAILGMTKSEIDKKIEDIIEFSEVREFIDTPVKRYSSGMYVKLAFSVAAHLDSEIMIMDEVLAVGDMAFQKKCLKKMRDAAKEEGRTVLYVSHNMNTIRDLCDRCVVLDMGKVIFDGDVDEAIDIYLKDNKTKAISDTYDLAAAYHQNRDRSVFFFTKLKVDNMNGKKFAKGAPIDVTIDFNAGKPLKSILFRFEFHCNKEEHFASAISKDPVDIEEPGKYGIKATIDTKNLSPGFYYVDLVAFELDKYGNQSSYDCVYPCLAFEIDDAITEENNMIWLHKWWGRARFDDIEVKDLEKYG